MDSKQSIYETVPIGEDYDARSSTEVDESLMSDERHWKQSHHERGMRPSRINRCFSAFQLWRWVIDTSLLVVILVLLVLLRREWQESRPIVRQVGGDYTGAGPQIPTKVIKWNADSSFVPNKTANFFSDRTLETWNSLMPAGAGWKFAGETFFTTSMTHQLHCLFMMGRVYAGVTENMIQRLPHDYHNHFLHCVDYLRQAIMCSADTALEPHSPDDSNDLGPLDGSWNGQHVCKDYNQVIELLEGQIKSGVRVVLPIDD